MKVAVMVWEKVILGEEVKHDDEACRAYHEIQLLPHGAKHADLLAIAAYYNLTLKEIMQHKRCYKLLGGIIMRTWKTEIKADDIVHVITIKEVEFDGDLHIFEVFNGEVKLGSIVPPGIDEMNDIVNDLDNGGCPITDKWEDGMGNICQLDGWGQE